MRYGCTSNGYSRFRGAMLLGSIIFCLLFMVGGIVTADALLGISVSIVEEDPFGPSDSFHYIVEIRNCESAGRIDVIVTYEVVNADDQVILSDTKTVAVETKSSFAESFTLPSSMEEGTYLLRATVNTLNYSTSSQGSRSFRVEVVEESQQQVIEYVLLGAIICTSGGLVYEHRRVSKLKVSGGDLKRFIGKKDQR